MPQLGSILTAMVTPFDGDLQINEASARALLRYLVGHGSDGVVVCGTTGEGSTLADEEHLGLVELAVDELRGSGATVVAGTGSNDTRHAVHLTERATALGVDATLSVTPYYNKPNRRGIIEHFRAVNAATDKPIILYNIPSRTGTDMSNELLVELGQLSNVTAIKQARETDLQLIEGLDLYAGNDDMLCDVLELGGVGGICVASHIFGEQMQAMVQEPQRRRELDAELQDAYSDLSITTNPIGIKAALNLLGHDVGGLRLPLVAASAKEESIINAMLMRHNLRASE